MNSQIYLIGKSTSTEMPGGQCSKNGTPRCLFFVFEVS